MAELAYVLMDQSIFFKDFHVYSSFPVFFTHILISLIDSSLTVESIYEAISAVTVERWQTVWYWGAMLQETMLKAIEDESLSDPEDKEEAHLCCATFYIRFNPKASWQHLCRILYQNEQHEAVKILKSHLPPKGKIYHIVEMHLSASKTTH